MSEATRRQPVVRWVVIGFLVFIGAGFLVLLFWPLSAERVGARRAVCASNLRQIGVCFAMYADMNGGRLPMDGNPPTLLGSMMLLTNVNSSGTIFDCPADAKHDRAIHSDKLTEKNISYCYVAGLRWDTNNPTPVMFDWVESTRGHASWPRDHVHKGVGNVLFTDGSVRSTKTPPVLDEHAVLLCPP